jgi:septum formation protein
VGLILASASPRRAELLTSAGYTFAILPVEVDETPQQGEPPLAYVLRVARAKAMAAARCCRESGSVVLAADTTVVAAGRILGKPRDQADAEQMLKTLSGAIHEVHTAVVVSRPNLDVSDVATTRVRLLPLVDSEIAWYIATGEPEGKAGAYAIQGRAARFIDWIEGSWSNVVGLPIATVYRLLKEVGEVD